MTPRFQVWLTESNCVLSRQDHIVPTQEETGVLVWGLQMEFQVGRFSEILYISSTGGSFPFWMNSYVVFQMSSKVNILPALVHSRRSQYWQHCRGEQGPNTFRMFCKPSPKNLEWAKAASFSLHLFAGARGSNIQKLPLCFHCNFATVKT